MLSLLALLLVTAYVPTAAAQAQPAPDPEELWRQFPLDDSRTQQAPNVGTPRRGERPTSVSPTEPGTKSGEDVSVLGFAVIVLAMAVVIALASGVPGGLGGPLRRGRGGGAAPITRSPRQIDALETLKAKRDVDRRAVEALKAKLSPPVRRKKETKNGDLETLKGKRKAAPSAANRGGKRSDGVDALKAKLRRASVAKRARRERQAVDRLRTKLQQRSGSPVPMSPPSARKTSEPTLEVVPDSGPAPLERARPTPAKSPRSVARGRTTRSGRNPRGAAAVALVPTDALPEVSEPPDHRPRVRCRIDLWRGYIKSQFDAIEQRPTGAQRVIASSPLFRVRGGLPLTPEPAAADAHAALIEELEQDGWCVVARGARWFDVELERIEGPPWLGLPER
jgi:hypothetical protein